MFFLDDYFLVVIVTVCSQKFHATFVHHHSLIHHEKHNAAMPKQASYCCCKPPGCLTRGSFLLPCMELVRRCGPGSKIKPVYQALSSLQRLSDRNFAVFSFHPQRKKQASPSVVRTFVTLKWCLHPKKLNINTVIIMSWRNENQIKNHVQKKSSRTWPTRRIYCDVSALDLFQAKHPPTHLPRKQMCEDYCLF